MSVLWTAEELRAATGGRCGDALAVRGVSIDTRTVQPGDLFVALRDQRDGHDFVGAAFAAGAAAMVDRDVPPGPTLRVADTFTALHALGAAGRARCAARVIAVTGSVGKTTTKEMLRQACAGLGATHASAASYNNHWGVPLTLARMPAATAWAAIEIGMNHRGEIAPLSRLAQPHVAVVTAIGTAHIGHLGSQEAIAEEKADITTGLPPGGVAVLPADSPFFPRMAAIARNFEFFGAPVGVLVHTPHIMGKPQWADLGIWLQTVMLLLVEQGLGSCAQEAWSVYPATVKRVGEIPDDHIFFCGLAIGYPDHEAPLNHFPNPRAPLDETVRFLSD